MEWVVLWLFFAVLVALLARKRGRSSGIWFFLAIVLSPIGAGLLVLILQDLSGPMTVRVIAEEKPAVAPMPRSGGLYAAAASEKKCPDCAEMVKVEARICRHCRYEFPPVEASKGQAAGPRGIDALPMPGVEDGAASKICSACQVKIPAHALVCRVCNARQGDDWPKPAWLNHKKG